MEGLSDRQAAEAVRSGIDWKYALGLDLADPGFDYSALSKFRARLIAGAAEMKLLDTMLERFKAQGLLKARGKQRTDSTHVLAAIRTLNRLESVGETDAGPRSMPSPRWLPSGCGSMLLLSGLTAIAPTLKSHACLKDRKPVSSMPN